MKTLFGIRAHSEGLINMILDAKVVKFNPEVQNDSKNIY